MYNSRNTLNLNEDSPLESIVQPEDALAGIELNSLSKEIQKAASDAGWKELTKVQSYSIPYILQNRDILVQSHTGSGKTGAFILPLIDKLNPDEKKCQALILVPTRELALQVCSEAEKLLKSHGLEAAAVYGGVSYKPQIEAFKNGVQIIIGTPGRILDHLIKRNLKLDNLKTLVLDEADRLLSMGFYPDMKSLHKFLPKKPRSSYMFSATFPLKVMSLSRIFLKDPEMLSLSSEHVHAFSTAHSYYRIPAMEKDRWLVKIIEMENPTSAIIFCNTKARVHYINEVLKRFGYDSDELTAELTQSKREKVLSKIKKGMLKFLVSTDIAARGIDISELSHVFQYEPPEDPEAYIHRSGRTGRAGASGKVITLTEGYEPIELKKIAKKFKMNIEECDLPTNDEISKLINDRTVAMLDSKLRLRDNLKKERMQRFAPLAKQLCESEDQIQLVAMIIDDYYHQSLHSPIATDESDDNEADINKETEKQNKHKKTRRKRRSNSVKGQRKTQTDRNSKKAAS